MPHRRRATAPTAHTRRVPLYGTPSLADYLRANGPWDQLVRLENVVLKPVEHGGTIRLHEQLEVTVIPVPHREEYTDTVGFLLRGPQRSLLYVPDTEGWDAWDPPLFERLEGVDVALLDGTFYSLDELPALDPDGPAAAAIRSRGFGVATDGQQFPL